MNLCIFVEVSELVDASQSLEAENYKFPYKAPRGLDPNPYASVTWK